MKQAAFIIAMGVFLFMCSCQKELRPGGTTTTPVDSTDTVPSTTSDLVKDTVTNTTKGIYLWYDQIPDTFNGRNYADPNAIMLAIRKYSKEPGFTDPVDRFSFADTKADWDNVSGGTPQDFGLQPFFFKETDLRVKLVEAASPAGLAGIKRGWRITAINGNTTIDESNASISMITQAVFESTSTTFTFQKPDGTSVDITLNAATYQTDPVYADSVYTLSNGKVVGYLCLHAFLGNTAQITNSFSRVFSKFGAANVTDVVVDLRYNGGGYVSLQEALANYLVPAAGDGQTMYVQTWNANYASYNSTAKFSKTGSVNVPRIFFIVSKNTASASELLINNLKPFVTEQLVGFSQHTYGKPVGFINLPVGDWYIFPVSFRTVNKNNEGSYFNGFNVDYLTADGLDKNWGDTEESCFASILNYIQTGSYGRFRTTETTQQERLEQVNNKLQPKHTFYGMIDTRKVK